MGHCPKMMETLFIRPAKYRPYNNFRMYKVNIFLEKYQFKNSFLTGYWIWSIWIDQNNIINNCKWLFIFTTDIDNYGMEDCNQKLCSQNQLKTANYRNAWCYTKTCPTECANIVLRSDPNQILYKIPIYWSQTLNDIDIVC